ncbi:MAG: S8 family serine peptidase [Candidatus Thermoplasmatota archaeon]|nr:S8 family serine peptidase [Candidatus Thermoplasmatota archaeon]
MVSIKEKSAALFAIAILFFSVLSVAGGALANSRPSKEEETEIVLLDTETEDISQINSMGPDVLERYGNRALVEGTEEEIDDLAERGMIYNTLPDRTKVSVKGHTFDIEKGNGKIDPSLQIDDYEPETEGLYIVHFLGPVNPEWRAGLEDKGVNIVNSVPNYAYEVSMTPEEAEEVESLDYVDWVGIYQPAYKLHSDVRPGVVDVTLRPNAERKRVKKLKSDLKILGSEDLEEGHRLILKADSEKELYDLAKMNDVYYISPHLEPQLHGEMDSQIIGGGCWFMDDEYAHSGGDQREGNPDIPYRNHGDHGAYINQIGYTGEGVTVSPADTGLGDGTVGNAGHSDLDGRVIGGYSFGSDPTNWEDGHGHGTHTAGSIAADAYGGTGQTFSFADYYMAQGLAYDSEVFATRIFDSGGSFLPSEYYPIVEEPAQRSDTYVHSNSWGSSTDGSYSDSDAVFDQAVREADRDTPENRPMVITVSAGNDGSRGDQTIGSPGTAKNVITVGATQTYNPDDGFENAETVADFSSRGWTEDNRIKPDVTAPGEGIYSLTPDGGYTEMSGTSMSNPAVAGAAASVVEWYEANEGETPSPAMVKSILINSARDLDPDVGNSRGHIPNRDEGWGIVDLSRLEYPKSDPVGLTMEDQPNLLTTGEQDEYQLTVDDPDKPLNITLAWTDKNAQSGDSSGGTPVLKNDLNLKVISPGGDVYRGNAFNETGGTVSDTGFSYPNTDAMGEFDNNSDGWDDVNNVENVYVHPDDLESGTYTVKVIGHDIPADANNDSTPNQDYALTAYNTQEDMIKNATFTLDRNEYSGNDTVNITLGDIDLAGEGTYDVNITSEDAAGTEIDSVMVTLTESPEIDGLFKGNVSTTTNASEQGLYVEHDGNITAWYLDEDPGYEGSGYNTTGSENDLMSTEPAATDDVGVTEITSPEERVNTSTHPVKSVVHNYGDNNLTGVPVNTTIKKMSSLLSEDFSGGVPPTGWTTESGDWSQSDSSEAGGTSPEADLDYSDITDDYSYLQTPAIDTTSSSSLSLNFNSYIYDYSGGYNCNVSIRQNSSDSWSDITPWSNPISGDVGPSSYDKDISSYIGTGTQVRFEFDGDSYGLWDWYMDDVQFNSVSTEYMDEVTVDVNAGANTTADFASWTPSEEAIYEMNSTTLLSGDTDQSNDHTIKEIEVIDDHDAATDHIISPTGTVGVVTQAVEANVSNLGTFDENVPVNATIKKISANNYAVDENFTSGLPTDWNVTSVDGNNNTWNETYGDYMQVDSTEDDEEDNMTTASYDLSSSDYKVELTFDSDYEGYNTREVYISNDGGSTWDLVDTAGSGTETMDLTQWAAGKNNVKVRFRFYNSYHSEPEWWRVDNVNITGYTTSPVYTDEINEPIDAGQDKNVTFADFTPPSPGGYLINVTTELSSDMDDTNNYSVEEFDAYNISDTGVEEIISPSNVVFNRTQNVTADVGNYGTVDETDVPVNTTIGKKVGLLKEDFNDEIPSEWTIDNESSETWKWDDGYNFDTPYAFVEEASSDVWQDEYLITPKINATNATNTRLKFDSDFYNSSISGDSYGDVLVSNDGGATWNRIVRFGDEDGKYDFDISTYADGSSDLKIGFRFNSTNGTSSYDDWSIDNVEVYYTTQEYTDEVTVDVNTGENTTATFANWTPSSDGMYIINSTTRLSNDSNQSNDSVRRTVKVRPVIYDLEATSIDTPVEPVYQYQQEVSGTVSNVGNQNITDTPVNMTIEPITEVTEVDENFSAGMPANWTTEDRNGNNNTWTDTNGDFMQIAPADAYEDDVLWTGPINCTVGTHRVLLEFESRYNGTNDRDMLISTDNGTTYQRIGSSVGEGNISYDLSQWASGEDNIMVGWQFYSMEVEQDEFWTIDNVTVTNEYTTPEYDSQAIIDSLNITQNTQLQFANWTPAVVPSDYVLKLKTMHPKDDNIEDNITTRRISVDHNYPPNKPTDPIPTDGETNVTHSPDLSVNVSDPNGDDLDVTFHLLNETGSEIRNKTVTAVESGTRAGVTFEYIGSNSTFHWYAEVSDGYKTNTSATFTFETYLPYSTWKTASAVINAKPPQQVDNLTVDWYGDTKVREETVWYDDVEGGDLGYLTEESHAEASDWGIRQHGSVSGNNSWDWGDGQFNKNSSHGMMSSLITPQMAIPEDGDNVKLTFQHWRDFGDSSLYDGGNLKISTTGANGNYQLIEPESGYDGTISDSYGNPLGGESGWGGAVGWETVTFDLTAYQGQTVHLNWTAGVEAFDGAYGAGWRVDDIRLKSIHDLYLDPVKGNEITWNASADDGAGADDVDHYVIYRSNYSTGPWDQSTIIDTVKADDSASYMYQDPNRGDDGIQWHYVVRAVDRVDNMDMNENSKEEPPMPDAVNPVPADEAQVDGANQTLSVDITTPIGQPVNVSFYQNQTDKLIGYDSGVMNGTASVSWNLSEEAMATNHSWYVVAEYQDYKIRNVEPYGNSWEFYLNDTALPVADAGGNFTAYQGDEITLDASNSHDNVGIANYTWNIEDPTGSSITLYHETTHHTLDYALNYTVSLNVTDFHGNHDTDTINVYSIDTESPVAQGGSHKLVKTNETFTLNGSASIDNIGIVDYQWVVEGISGDAANQNYSVTLQGDVISHSLPYSGSYDATLIVTDAENNSDTAQVGIFVEKRASDLNVLNLTAPNRVVEGDKIMINGTVENTGTAEGQIDLVVENETGGVVQSWTYTVGAGKTLNITENVTLEKPGDYTVTLGDRSETVTVEEAVPEFDVSNMSVDPTEIVEGEQVTINGTVENTGTAEGQIQLVVENETGIVVESWNYTVGAGNTTHISENVTLQEPGVYTVTIGDKSETVTVEEAVPEFDIADLSVDPSEIVEGEQVTINGTVENVGTAEGQIDLVVENETGIVVESWTYTVVVDEVIDITENITLQEPGDYEVILGSESRHMTVVEEVIADAGEDRSVDEDTRVVLDAGGSSGDIAEYIWTIDGEEYRGELIPYTFDEPGEYEVTLTVKDGEDNTDSDAVMITVKDATDPVADAGEDKNVEEDTEVIFDGNASSDNVEIVEYTWNITGEEFGGERINYTFDDPGEYEVTLTVRDAEGNTDTDTVIVTVKDITDPVADAGEDKNVDEDTDVTFDGTGSSDNVEIVDYIWNIEGEEFDVRMFDYTFDDPGEYEVTLMVRDAAGNTDTDTLNVTVKDATAPVADVGEDKNVEEGDEVTFDGSGSSDNVEIVEYNWTIDGDKFEGKMVNYTFHESGEYDVTLMVKDAAGNSGSNTITVDVAEKTVEELTAVVAGGNRSLDKGEREILNAGNSTGNISEYVWTIDGEEYVGKKIPYTFDESGEHIVTLTVRDGSGNEDTQTISVDVSEAQVSEEGMLDGFGLSLYLIPIIILLLIVIGLLYTREKDTARRPPEPPEESRDESSFEEEESTEEELFGEEESGDESSFEEEESTEEELFGEEESGDESSFEEEESTEEELFGEEESQDEPIFEEEGSNEEALFGEEESTDESTFEEEPSEED